VARSCDLRLSARSDPRLLGSIRSLVRGWVEAFGLAPDRTDEVVLAIDEACSNAIRHSYRGRCDRAVELNLRTAGEFLEFEVCDHGQPCPPEHLARRDLRTPTTADLKPGGLGVQLIYVVFDEVEFRPGKTRGNRVIMRLRRPEHAEG
jgi:anti-sigma regulatory factor (Ser/Thr protein kinase)